jgi:hypothetical protein
VGLLLLVGFPVVIALLTYEWQLIRRSPSGRFVLMTASVAASSAIAVSAALTVLSDPEAGRVVLGGLVVFAVFRVLGRLGTSRWQAWDEQERLAFRRSLPREKRTHVAVQGILLFASAVYLVMAVAFEAPFPATAALACALIVVVFGIGLDAAAAQEQGTILGGSTQKNGSTGAQPGA